MTDSVIPHIRLGISSCLLGEAVRFDGGHARDRFLTDALMWTTFEIRFTSIHIPTN